MWRLVLLAWLSVAAALPAQEARSLQPSRNAIQPENDIYSDCFRKDSTTCFKLRLFSLIDRISFQDKPYTLTEGVTVVKTMGAEKEGAPRSLTGDESFGELALSRLQSFLDSHTLNVELKGSDVVNAVTSSGRALEEVAEGFLDTDNSVEGRGKKKKAAKILGPLMAALALKAAALLPLVLGAIALIAGKALLVGKLALVLSAIIGLKKLLSHQKHVTYEVVAHPHHSSSHSSGHAEYSSGSGYADGGGGYGGSSHGGGWGRAIDAQEQAYSAQRPTQ